MLTVIKEGQAACFQGQVRCKGCGQRKGIFIHRRYLIIANHYPQSKKADASASEDSSSGESSSEDEKPASKPQASASKSSAKAKAVPTKAISAKVVAKASSSSSSESDSEESDDDKPKKVVTAAKPATSSEESSSDDEKPKVAQVKAAATKKTSTSESSSSSEEEKPKAASKKAAVKGSSDSSDSESSSEDEAPKKAAASAKKVSPAKPVASKVTPAKKAAASSSESSDSESEKPAAKKADSSSEESSDEDVDMADASSKPGNSKRKAEDDAPQPAKKAKVADAPASSESTTKTVFVGRLSWNVDNDWLATEFAECGEVESARVQMDRNTGKSRGFGYVTFTTAEAVEAALALTGKEIDSRPINVDRSIEKDQNTVREQRAKAFGDSASPPSSVIFVGNLSFDASEDILWEAFSEYGDIKSVRMPTDRETGRPKGFGYVEFSDIEAAKKAHEGLAGQEIAGRPIRVDYSQPRDDSGGARGGRGGFGGGRGGFGGGRGGGRGGFGGDRGGRGGFGGDRGGRGGFGGRGGGRVCIFSAQAATFLLTSLFRDVVVTVVVAAAAAVHALAPFRASRVRRLPSIKSPRLPILDFVIHVDPCKMYHALVSFIAVILRPCRLYIYLLSR